MQLMNIPENIEKYYPSDKYYSFDSSKKKNIHTDLLRKIKAGYILYGKNKLAGRLLSLGYTLPTFFEWLKTAKIKIEDSILDVGCGGGGLLISLYKNGFKNLTGIDPYNKEDIDYGGFKIYKKQVFDLNGQYDFIMLNHVFEHIEEPWPLLDQLFKLLKPGKFLLIRTPVMGTYGWQHYGENWMALDAPRHQIIHSIGSLKLLAEAAGFTLTKIVFDGDGNSLIASEQYKMDIPLTDIQSSVTNKDSKLFTEKEINSYNRKAVEENERKNGDQAAFYLYKPA